MRSLVVITLTILLFAESAFAASLTCADFQHRLTEAIGEGGNKVARPDPFVEERNDPGVGKKFGWTGIVGLDGGLSCGPENQFESFSAEINTAAPITPDGFQAASLRLVSLVSASIRALTSSRYEDAEKMATSMFGGAMRGMKAEVDRGERMPAGLNDSFLFPGVDGEFAITPVGISWLLGPQNGHSMDFARLRLAPELRDGTQ